MSWVVENHVTYLQRFCANILKYGPVPKHIAIIMDGNRRFADRNKIERLEGHKKGFNKLVQVLQYSELLGIKEVTVYAFSIENFKRDPDEVRKLFQLAQGVFQRIMGEDKEEIMKMGVCVNFIGNFSKIPANLQNLFAKIMLMTQNNKTVTLNVAFSYTSHDEITHAVKTVVAGVERHDIDAKDVNEQLLSACMYTNQSPNPDLIIRSSGEVRFSNFMLWQIWKAQFMFVKVLWPEIGFWNFLRCIFRYQRTCLKGGYVEWLDDTPCEPRARVVEFLKKLEEKKWATLHKYAKK